MNRRTLTFALSVLVLAACGDTRDTGGGNPSAAMKPVVQGPLFDPASPEMVKRSPDTYRAKFETTAGDFVVEVTRAWAPRASDRFYNLVRNGYYDGNAIFRVEPGFVTQWGMHGDPGLNAIWANSGFLDEPVRQKNTKGTVTFAKTPLPNSRTTHIFVNYADNSASLDGRGFAPFGRVVEGMAVVESFNAEYERDAPDQDLIAAQGDRYLSTAFPRLDRILKAYIVE